MFSNRKEQFMTGDLTLWAQLLEKKRSTRWTLQVAGKHSNHKIYFWTKMFFWFFWVKNLLWMLRVIFSQFFPYLMSPTLCPNVKLTSSHFAKSGIHRRFFLEIAMENNSYRHLDYTNTTHMVSLLNLLSLLLWPFRFCQQWRKNNRSPQTQCNLRFGFKNTIQVSLQCF